MHCLPMITSLYQIDDSCQHLLWQRSKKQNKWYIPEINTKMSDLDHFVCLQSIDIDIVISTSITTIKAPNLNQSNHQNIHLSIIFPVSVIYMTRELRVFIQSKCCSWWKKLLMKVPTLVKDVVKKAWHRDDR